MSYPMTRLALQCEVVADQLEEAGLNESLTRHSHDPFGFAWPEMRWSYSLNRPVPLVAVATAVREGRFDWALLAMLHQFKEADKAESVEDGGMTLSDAKTPKTVEWWRRLVVQLGLSNEDIEIERQHEIAIVLNEPGETPREWWWAKEMLNSLPNPLNPSMAEVLMALRTKWPKVGPERRRLILRWVEDSMPLDWTVSSRDFVVLAAKRK